MTDQQSRRERWAEADRARADAAWGLSYVPEDESVLDAVAAARAATERGDSWYQTDVVTTTYQGTYHNGQNYSRVLRSAPFDFVGAIEREGWAFATMSTCFVQRGGRSANDAFSTAGDLVITYLFRAARP